MPVREFDTGFWGNPDVRKLVSLAKLLEIWTFTNAHCSPSGLYEVAPETITFDTGILAEELPALFKQLEPKVIWYPEKNLVWVKNFIKRQAKSSTFLKAVGKSLALLNHEDIIQELLEYNRKRYEITIPYEYYRQKFARLSKISSSLEGGETPPGKIPKSEDIVDPKLATIVKCYEENIGMLTPMLFEHLKDIADAYPDGWFEKAVAETNVSGKRNLKYTERILERWKDEGINPISIKHSRQSTKLEVEK